MNGKYLGKVLLEGEMVLKENKQALYFNMIMGTIGNILIAIATIKYVFLKKMIL